MQYVILADDTGGVIDTLPLPPSEPSTAFELTEDTAEVIICW